MTTHIPVADGVVLCLHPNQTGTVRQSRPRRVPERRKTGPRRWALRTFTMPSRPLLDVSCPDCPARAVYITELGTTPMAPWLLAVKPKEPTS